VTTRSTHYAGASSEAERLQDEQAGDADASKSLTLDEVEDALRALGPLTFLRVNPSASKKAPDGRNLVTATIMRRGSTSDGRPDWRVLAEATEARLEDAVVDAIRAVNGKRKHVANGRLR
jgi:hypothetical protein